MVPIYVCFCIATMLGAIWMFRLDYQGKREKTRRAAHSLSIVAGCTAVLALTLHQWIPAIIYTCGAIAARVVGRKSPPRHRRESWPVQRTHITEDSPEFMNHIEKRAKEIQ